MLLLPKCHLPLATWELGLPTRMSCLSECAEVYAAILHSIILLLLGAILTV